MVKILILDTKYGYIAYEHTKEEDKKICQDTDICKIFETCKKQYKICDFEIIRDKGKGGF